MVPCLAACSLAAQEPGVASWTNETVQSTVLGATRTVYVSAPGGYGGTTARYPVLVILDADDRSQFSLALANVAFLANRGAIPPLIVVGVPNGRDRTHDLTPPATGSSAKFAPTAGGARAFASFLVKDVLPLIRSKYRALPTTVLAGHSYGGLFALDVAATDPAPFAGVIALSPSLWWNDSSSASHYANAIAKAGVRQRLFTASGGLEPLITGPTSHFVARLDSIKPATLAFAYQRYADDTHQLTPGAGLADGLRFVFQPVAWQSLPLADPAARADSAAVGRALRETERRYADSARSIGLPDRLPETVLDQFGYSILRAGGDPKLALKVFRLSSELHTDSPHAYRVLADAYLALADTAAARAALRRAVETARAAGLRTSEEAADKLSELEGVRRGRIDDREDLDSVRVRYVSAYNAGNADALARFYTESAVRMPYDSPEQRGIAAIVSAYRNYFTRRRFDAKLELIPESVVVTADRALERGAYHETQTARDGSLRREDGKYFVVATREGASWKYELSMFNRDSAAVAIKRGGAAP